MPSYRLFRFRCESMLAGGLCAMIAAPAGIAGDMVLQPKMGEPLHGLTVEQLELFETGRVFFDALIPFEPGESEVIPQGGLGPLHNALSCGVCHNVPLGGAGNKLVTRFGTIIDGTFDPLEDWGGSLHKESSIFAQCVEELPVDVPGYHSSFRVTNGALAYGLIEAIPDAAIIAVRDAQPKDVRGRINWVVPLEDDGRMTERAGRFGWKAQIATVLSFSGAAAMNEMGLTNALAPDDDDPNGIYPPNPGDPDYCTDSVRDPEDFPDEFGYTYVERVTHFQRYVAPYPQTPKSGMTGEAIFEDIGCGVCHTKQFTTPDDPSLEDALRNVTFQPYADFLLHDVGSTADFIAQDGAGMREIRTPPLSGLRVREPLWHDGRVIGGTFEQRILQAVALHCGEGSQAWESAARFLDGAVFPKCETCPACEKYETKDGLNDAQRAHVIAFLESLGRAEFDADGDSVIGPVDLHDLRACSMLDVIISPDDACAVHDIDQSGGLDMTDFDAFVIAYDESHGDCNSNGQDDLLDILLDVSNDRDGNGVPDECLTYDADITGDGFVGPADLAFVLGTWGPCRNRNCPADLNDDGAVGPADLAIVLGNWS